VKLAGSGCIYRLLPVLVLGGLLYGGASLHAQEDPQAVRLDWAPRPEAEAYWVQIRDHDREIVLDERVKGESFTFRIIPGDYNQRIAAINRFGTPGPWSPWQPLRIRATRTPRIGALAPLGATASDGSREVEVRGDHFTQHTRVYLQRPGQEPREVPVRRRESNRLVVRLTPADFRDGNYSLVVQNPRGLSQRKDETVAIVNRRIEIPEKARRPDPETPAEESGELAEEGPAPGGSWQSLIPGLPALYRGEASGALWAGAIGGFAALSAYEYQAALAARRSFESKFSYQYFQNPLLFGGHILSNTATPASVGALTALYLQDRSAAQGSYSGHARRHVLFASAAAFTWGAHFLWENRGLWQASHLVPGMTFFQRGQNLRGGVWLGSLSAAGAGALLANGASGRDVMAGVFGALYLGQIIDATLSGEMAPPPDGPAEDPLPSAFRSLNRDEEIQHISWHIRFN
jgi:hypothetical protein